MRLRGQLEQSFPPNLLASNTRRGTEGGQGLKDRGCRKWVQPVMPLEPLGRFDWVGRRPGTWELEWTMRNQVDRSIERGLLIETSRSPHAHLRTQERRRKWRILRRRRCSSEQYPANRLGPKCYSLHKLIC